MLTPLQETAIAAWKQSKNVRVIAVPGAGKSRVLIEAARVAQGLCIILAYNRDLCQDTKAKIEELGMGEWVVCMTFHGLATYCVTPTHDDVTLATVLDELDQGATSFKRIRNVRAILIDEAQDFRPSFLRLIRHVIEMSPNTQYMTVGDPRQMLYDYNEDDPARLDYLLKPHEFFLSNRPWTTVQLYETHRMTPEMAFIVGNMFNLRLESPKEPGHPVEVFTIKVWSAGALVRRLLQGLDITECVILVPYKKGNSPLEKMVNALSKSGFRLHVHGLDGQDPRVRRNKLVVSTWHASKGTQRRVCIVLGLTQHSDINPSFVALTRGIERLIVVQDEASPHHGLMRAIKDAPQDYVRLDDATRRMLVDVGSLPDPPMWTRSKECINLDTWRPSGTGRWVCDIIKVLADEEEGERESGDDEGGDDDAFPCDDDAFPCDDEVSPRTDELTTEEEDEIIAGLVGEHEDVAEVYRLACVMAVERHVTSKVRRIAEVISPTRIKREAHIDAIKAGSHARFVSPTVPDDVLLDCDHRARVCTLYNKARLTVDDWCYLACACRAWNNYHHMLQQLDPFDWMTPDKMDSGVERIQCALRDESNVEFDMRLSRDFQGHTLHARCDASSDESVYIFQWQSMISHGSRIEAAVLAALHPRAACVILNLKTGRSERVILDDRDAMLEKLVASNERRAPRTTAPAIGACIGGDGDATTTRAVAEAAVA